MAEETKKPTKAELLATGSVIAVSAVITFFGVLFLAFVIAVIVAL